MFIAAPLPAPKATRGWLPDLTRNGFTDNTAANGITYYYVVTALDSLEKESANSNEASAQPVSGQGLGLVAEYKFENGAMDSSGNGFNGTVWRRTRATSAARWIPRQSISLVAIIPMSRFPTRLATISASASG